MNEEWLKRMIENVLKKKDLEDLNQLANLAKEQNGSLNLNMVLMTIANINDKYDAVMNYFDERGIVMIQDDIEPDVTAYTCEGEVIKPFDPAKIDITMKPLTLDALLKRIKNEEIEFDTSFQRKAGLWSKRQKSQLMESIFLKIPLPAFYFDATDEDQWLIIDGLQRVSTLKEFVVDKKLKLQDMEFFQQLEGCTYDDLPRLFKRRIDETVINVYLVNPTTPKNVKFNIFKRINTGGLTLESQEIRNALYQGAATDLLKKCAEKESFLTATAGSIKSERMLDREFVLRYVAFCHLGLQNYTTNIDEFLNEAMKYLNHISEDKLKKIEKEFDWVMNGIYKIMGNYAFRKIARDGRRRPINKVIYESWCYVLRKYTPFEIDRLIERKAQVFQRYMELCESPEYLYLLKAPDKKAVLMRIDEVNHMLYGVLEGTNGCDKTHNCK